MKFENKVIFLDYDGVINTPMWDNAGRVCRYNHPGDNSVNNFQAVQWVSEFCQKHNFDIVITSTWRRFDNYKECLVNGGLRRGIKILGCTPALPDAKDRGEEIEAYLKEHPETKIFLIFDDDTDMGKFVNRLVKCDPYRGFGMRELQKAESLLCNI